MATRALTVQARVGAARREATRERILDAARQMLERGDSVSALTVSKLAAEAEVSRATFYLHFPDKRELIDALAAPSREEWESIASDALSDPHVTRDEIRRVVREGLDNWSKHAAVLSGVVELAEYDPEVRQGWRASVAHSAENNTRWIAASRPDLPEETIRALGELLAWAGERSAHQMLGPHSQDPACIDALTEAMTELWWRLTRPESDTS
ncbi:MAG: TetR/AcrR family transcriptional regulator [Solirubrobacteraceae bacterium]|nr:TetR/AcrR family transcriptional regulator [Solirubrobacteraceae bacterium]